MDEDEDVENEYIFHENEWLSKVPLLFLFLFLFLFLEVSLSEKNCGCLGFMMLMLVEHLKFYVWLLEFRRATFLKVDFSLLDMFVWI